VTISHPGGGLLRPIVKAEGFGTKLLLEDCSIQGNPNGVIFVPTAVEIGLGAEGMLRRCWLENVNDGVLVLWSKATVEVCVAKDCRAAGFKAQFGAMLEARRCIAVTCGPVGFDACDEGTFVSVMDCRSEQNDQYGFLASSKAVLWVQGECTAAKNGTQDYYADEGAKVIGLSETDKHPDWQVLMRVKLMDYIRTVPRGAVIMLLMSIFIVAIVQWFLLMAEIKTMLMSL
jgi:hypothetical protein